MAGINSYSNFTPTRNAYTGTSNASGVSGASSSSCASNSSGACCASAQPTNTSNVPTKATVTYTSKAPNTADATSTIWVSVTNASGASCASNSSGVSGASFSSGATGMSIDTKAQTPTTTSVVNDVVATTCDATRFYIKKNGSEFEVWDRQKKECIQVFSDIYEALDCTKSLKDYYNDDKLDVQTPTASYSAITTNTPTLAVTTTPMPITQNLEYIVKDLLNTKPTLYGLMEGLKNKFPGSTINCIPSPIDKQSCTIYVRRFNFSTSKEEIQSINLTLTKRENLDEDFDKEKNETISWLQDCVDVLASNELDVSSDLVKKYSDDICDILKTCINAIRKVEKSPAAKATIRLLSTKLKPILTSIMVVNAGINGIQYASNTDWAGVVAELTKLVASFTGIGSAVVLGNEAVAMVTDWLDLGENGEGYDLIYMGVDLVL